MSIAPAIKKYFTRYLMQWHLHDNVRELPWKKETDPYRIWLSEIIMQQTRVEQGMPYYEKFIAHYSSIKKLASAADTEVYRLWQGLGYYNRCKNLLETARFIAYELNGKFPETYEEILKLKGIGNYTAAAIASFAYRLPYAVVDGNVQRVLARFFGIETPVDSTQGKKYFQALAQELIDKEQPHLYNQAIMDFGAVVCRPVAPLCSKCVLQGKCFAYKKEVISLLPVKAQKNRLRKRYFHFILLQYKDQIWIQKRIGKDIWLHLHQPYLIETEHALSENELKKRIKMDGMTKWLYEGEETQRLSHQLITSQFYSVRLKTKPVVESDEGTWMALKDLKKIAFPKTVISFFQKKNYF